MRFANFTSIILALALGAVIAGGFRTMVHSGGEPPAIANPQTELAEAFEEKCAQANLNLKVCHCVVEHTLKAIPAQEMASLPMPEGATKWIKRSLYACDR